jgi:hypothetical protein
MRVHPAIGKIGEVWTPPPKNVEQNILEYVDRKIGTIYLSKRFHVGAAVGMLVVLLLLPLSSAIDYGEFDHGGGGEGGGGLVAAAAAAVAVVDDNWRQKQPAMRASTVA